MTKQVAALVMLGSNYLPLAHMEHAKLLLHKEFGDDVTVAKPVWTAAVDGSDVQYLNCLVLLKTNYSLSQLEAALKRIEAKVGRTVSETAEAEVCMDLDVMLFDGKRYHEKNWCYPFVGQLLDDLKACEGVSSADMRQLIDV